jgi:hypothetical protein
MEHLELPEWESKLIEEAIAEAERRRGAERDLARKRALQLAREQGYHRLAVAIDRPARSGAGLGQLRLFALEGTLFDD